MKKFSGLPGFFKDNPRVLSEWPEVFLGMMKEAFKGSGEPNKVKNGRVTREQLEKIATMKMENLNAKDMDGAVRMIAGTARSMGIETDI